MKKTGIGVGVWLGGLLLGGLSCGDSSVDFWKLIHASEGTVGEGGGGEPQAPPTKVPVDPRISRDCLQQQLTPYIDAVGAGWPAAFRPTGTVLVSAANQTLYSYGFGAADFEQGRDNTPRTSFRVGSITKGFTAAGILQLAESGQLELDDTIGEHLPEYPQAGAGVTIHQLLSHTAGVPNYTEDAELMATRSEPITPEELLASFWDKPLEFEPGTEFRYSNSGYIVLGALIERISGEPYAEYMQGAIFDPAGLERTTVGDAEGLADRASGYTSDLHGRLVPSAPIDMSFPYAAGAIRSTALDLARWHYKLGTDQLLNANSRELLTTPVLEGYGYGWGAYERDGLKVVLHGGGIDGFLSSFVRIPELDLTILVLLNAETVATDSIADAALRCALGENIEPEPPPALVELNDRQRQRLMGTYSLTEESRQLLESVSDSEENIEALASVEVWAEDGDLFLELNGYSPDLMLATSEADFVLPLFDEIVHFEFADDPAMLATRLEIGASDFLLSYTR